MAEQPFHYGGQAVIEGVMIRGQRHAAIAVRRPEGDITTSIRDLSPFYTGRLRRVPLLRGILVLVETLVLGLGALFYSARVAVGEEEEDSIGSWVLWGTAAVAFLLGLGLFLVLPLFLVRYLDPHLTPVIGNLVEGIVRLFIFLLYLRTIALMPDIRRVFAYHGAEHKTVNAYEDGSEMEVRAVQRYQTAHPRCGTAFLLVVLVIAILAFAFLGRPALPLRLASRIALLPVIAAVGYEVVRFGASHVQNRLVRGVLAPGLLLQRMTTQEPEDHQVEVAITALEQVMEADSPPAPAPEKSTSGYRYDTPAPPASPGAG